VQGSAPHARVSSFWQQYNDKRRKYRPHRQVCLHQRRKQVPFSLASQLSTPSCAIEWRKTEYQCKRKALKNAKVRRES
jgi:hypothetical protein